MAETSFTVRYAGPALDDHRMDVRQLAPALLALADLLRDSAAVVAPDEPPLQLRILATSQGSFEVELSIVQNAVKSVVDFFSGDTATALVNLRDTLFVGAGSLVWLIRTLRKRAITRRDETPAGIILVLDDGTTLVVPSDTLQLYDSLEVRRRMRDVLQPLAHDEDITSITFHADRQRQQVTADAIGSFDTETQAATLTDATTTLALQLTGVTFRSNRKWRLTDGSVTYSAAIDDQAFLERVDAGDEVFRAGDILRVDLRTVQTEDETGLHVEHTVTRVLDHRAKTTPPTLPYDQETDPDPQG